MKFTASIALLSLVATSEAFAPSSRPFTGVVRHEREAMRIGSLLASHLSLLDPHTPLTCIADHSECLFRIAPLVEISC